jgi:hypothetical protein
MSEITRFSLPAGQGDGSQQRPQNRALDHALRVLDLFADGPKLLGVTEIARSVGLDKSTVSRIVTTLAQHGYLSRSEDDRRRLSLRSSCLLPTGESWARRHTGS